MQPQNKNFKHSVADALKNISLQTALKNLNTGFVSKRRTAIENLPEFDQIRDYSVEIKNHALQYLDFYLQEFEKQVKQQGGQVHWAEDADDACHIAIAIAHDVNAKLITKGKSMVTEEIGLNKAFINAGFNVVETDLGEYIIQLRDEAPSHIVVPAIHVLKEQVAENFFEAHKQFDSNRSLNNPEEIVSEARHVLRDKFLSADIGVTGANFLIAENGAVIIVTNEGNGDLTQTCANTHIVVAGIEKIVPTINDAMNLLRLLPRSATGQEITSYVTFAFGSRRKDDLDGPENYHVILVDNGRSKMLGTEMADMLRCIRCGACLNHCPVYSAIGGQAYGSVYPGPMGAVLSPSLFGIKHHHDLPNASTFCGRCEQVCPMRIPLPKMMRHYREQEFTQKISPLTIRAGLKSWAFVAKNPWLYHLVMSVVSIALRVFGSKKGRSQRFLGASSWTEFRDIPIPASKTFHALWRAKEQK